ncbi:MAG: protein translocase subunit SecD [Planctomycetota bacterium]|nr:protein translocase subunit SecD [Planctomycetota bacterium]
MVENLGRKITLIVSLLVISILSLVIGRFRLGLDLEGGTRLAYSLDLKAAYDAGEILEEDYRNPQTLWNQIREILQKRLDPDGVREIVIRLEGNERFVVEMPGSASALRESVSTSLAAELLEGGGAIVLAMTDEEALRFPSRGAQVEIGNETIRYSRRIGNRLEGLERNYGAPVDAPLVKHSAGAPLTLVALDPWRSKIENLGSLEVMMEAQPSDLAGSGTDLSTELTAAQTWANDPSNANTSIEDYNNLLAKRGGAVKRLRFYPFYPTIEGKVQKSELPGNDLRALIVEENEAWRFRGADIPHVFYTQDEWGKPAVGFRTTSRVQSAFGNFTEDHIGEGMGIVINGEVATIATINDRLPGRSTISGSFTIDEANDLVTVLKSGSLPLRPRFEGQETVGASLGDAYVKRGFLGIGIGLLTVLIFMVVYYRRLGVFAALSLVANLIFLTGALAFLQATLTLPGVAGILLTVGMAVDANILIYERIREEADRGRKPLQSAKGGFQHALSTIVDANLTTLITGLILYRFGSGPVRGFATTLSIGILTSMFSALVVTRVLVHMQLEKGIDGFSMVRLIHETKVAFMAKAKSAMVASGVVIAIGLGLFFTIDDKDKLGIDFLGGMTMSITLEEGMTREALVSLIEAIPEVGDSADVKPIRNSAGAGDTFTRYRITAKGAAISKAAAKAAKAEAADKDGAGTLNKGNESALEAFREAVELGLAGKLAKGPVEEVDVQDQSATGFLYMERNHTEADLMVGLGNVGVTNATVTEDPSRGPRVFSFSGTVSSSLESGVLKERLVTDLPAQKDSGGTQLNLASPIDEVNAVGAQVVAELRDKALFAVLLSLFAAVMYIRVRFAEYSFGFAAVIALTHDVLVTLGALAVADMFIPFIDTEINLPMIAAFLTIIGYSLNDTIVVFDRVRENLPRMKGTLSEIIDKSINQCLARTVLTSVTTLISVSLLFAFNVGTGNVIEGFSFALMIGVVVGTYSSMFIASPALLWLETRRQSGLDDDDPTKHGVEVADPAAV